MSTKEKQATPKAAFVFLVPLANEQPAEQAGKRASAGSRADESTKEKQATPKAAFVFHVPLANEQPAKQAGARERTRARKKNKRRRKESDQTDRVYK
jgi:hypothetical protein